MAPDRGFIEIRPNDLEETDSLTNRESMHRPPILFQAEHTEESQNFTVRGVLVGLAVGLIICFSNTYFGLQSGWVSSMSMPSSLIGFAFFKTLSRHLDIPFTPVENVLVQTVAGSMGTMPLGCGFVGVMPALNYMLKPEEGGPIFLSLWKLIFWALGICYFGVIFAVPLRRQVIIREKLRFPSGTATALMISVLHGKEEAAPTKLTSGTVASFIADDERTSIGAAPGLSNPVANLSGNSTEETYFEGSSLESETQDEIRMVSGWRAKVKLLIISFAMSGLYTLGTYFVPILRNLPIFGPNLATTWLWTLNPSFAYIGQGIIMGPATTLHMLVGAVVGWGILSPLAKNRGWAPGAVDDWDTGSKGWIVWLSLAIMLADAIISLGYLICRSLFLYIYPYTTTLFHNLGMRKWASFSRNGNKSSRVVYFRIGREEATQLTPSSIPEVRDGIESAHDQDYSSEVSQLLPEVDAPAEQLVSNTIVWGGMVISILFCVLSIHVVFGSLVPLYATIASVFMALILSIMGVRALGETDLNPVSGISKLAQLFFAFIIPQSNKNSVLINLIAGAVSEAGALQAGDLMQDLKTGHLLGAAPNAQFWGQIIGSTVGAVVSALIYRLYTSIYIVPGELFQVPTGYVWIFTARLVTGNGLPPMAWQWAVGVAIVFTITTGVRIAGSGKAWHPYIPGGIAVAVGMYNVPSFTLARTIGGVLNWYWSSYLKRQDTPMVVLASGLILGEGVVSIVNLLMASLGVPHF